MNRKLELDKNLIDAYHFHRNDMFREALECYMAAAELDGENEDIWFEMGSCLHALGNYKKALECGITALKLNSSLKQVWYNCGLSLSMMSENERALDFLTEAIKLDRDYHMAYFARANTHFQLENWAEAVKDYTEALSLAGGYLPENEESHYYRACCYERLDSLDFAKADYTWVLNRSPRRYDALRRRALLSYREGRYESSLRDIRRAREIYPESKKLAHMQKKIEQSIGKGCGETNPALIL